MPAFDLAGAIAMSAASDAVMRLVTEALREQTPEARPLFLRTLMAHAAAGLTLLEGCKAASEVVYRLGDAMVGDAGTKS